MSIADLLQFHAFCLTNTGSRMEQYSRALERVVRPGDTVLDLGTGTGLLALLACRYGASRVFAIESSDAIRFGELLAADAHAARGIEFIKGVSTQLTLPQPVQVIVGDIHDTFGLQSGGLRTFMDARDRFLAQDGTLVPSTTRLLVIPVEAETIYRTQIDVWTGRVEGIDLSPIRPLAVNQVHAARFGPDNLLAAPETLAVVDFMRATSTHVGGTATTVVRRDGVLHGVCGCFVTTLADGIAMGNVPGDAATTNFAQAFLPLEMPVPVAAGDHVGITVDSRDGHAVRWRVEVSRAGSPAFLAGEHSSFEALPLTASALRKQAQDYRPRLNTVGTVERALLDRFDGLSTAADLEEWLQQEFGEQFASSHEASALLKAVIERCG